jgi:hypothetical protein
MSELWTLLPNGKVRNPSGKQYFQIEIQDQIDDGRIELVSYSHEEERPSVTAQVRLKINAHRDQIVTEDFSFSSKIYDADEKSVRNMKEKLLEIELLDPSAQVVWITKDDEVVQMTHQQFKTMLLAIGRRKDAAYLRANILKKGLTSRAISTLKNYDVASEW